MSGVSTRGSNAGEAVVADEPGELGPQVDLHILGVKRLEGPVVRLLKEDGNSHDLTRMQLGGSSSSMRPSRQQFALPGGSKLPPELVHRTVHFEYTHSDTSGLGRMGF
jgi:hypothetical protein